LINDDAFSHSSVLSMASGNSAKPQGVFLQSHQDDQKSKSKTYKASRGPSSSQCGKFGICRLFEPQRDNTGSKVSHSAEMVKQYSRSVRLSADL
jgi:hypothetical protein